MNSLAAGKGKMNKLKISKVDEGLYMIRVIEDNWVEMLDVLINEDGEVEEY